MNYWRHYPKSVRPLAMGALSQHVPPDDPIKIVITFAKMKDTGTPPQRNTTDYANW